MSAPSLAAQVAAINTQQPWFAPHATALKACQQALAQGAGVAQALNALPDRAPQVPRFVAASQAPEHEAYEAFIARSGGVPTRDNLHDLFNGLCWCRFPQTKRRLNQLQAQCIAKDGIRPVRGPVRDALTLLDENGAVLQAPAALWQALRERRWAALFGELRPLWQQARLTLIGHALLEKLASPRKDLTAHVLIAPATMNLIANSTLAELDVVLGSALNPARLGEKPFTPLPVLGVPGWWPGNHQADFLGDARVFRPAAPATPNNRKLSVHTRAKP